MYSSIHAVELPAAHTPELPGAYAFELRCTVVLEGIRIQCKLPWWQYELEL